MLAIDPEGVSNEEWHIQALENSYVYKWNLKLTLLCMDLSQMYTIKRIARIDILQVGKLYNDQKFSNRVTAWALGFSVFLHNTQNHTCVWAHDAPWLTVQGVFLPCGPGIGSNLLARVRQEQNTYLKWKNEKIILG